MRLRAHLVAGTRNPRSGSPTSPASANWKKSKVKPRRRWHFPASANHCSRGYGGPRGQKSPARRERAYPGVQLRLKAQSVLRDEMESAGALSFNRKLLLKNTKKNPIKRKTGSDLSGRNVTSSLKSEETRNYYESNDYTHPEMSSSN